MELGTTQKRIEKLKYWEPILDMVENGVALVNQDDYLSYANSQLLSFFGHPYESILGQPMATLFHNWDRVKNQCFLPSNSKTQRPRHPQNPIQLTACLNNQSLIEVEGSVLHWNSPSGQEWGIVIKCPPASTIVGVEKEAEFRVALVELTGLAIGYWEHTTDKNKVALADEMGVWRVILEKRGVFRVRTLERHLNLKTLPKKPCWREVLKTADFVLRHCPDDPILKPELENKLRQLKQQLPQI